MKKIYVIHSSLNQEQSVTGTLATYTVDALQTTYGPCEVVHRDVMADPLPYLDHTRVAALGRGDVIDSADAQEARRMMDTLTAELKDADVIIFGAPMYNFFIPAQLKTYFDYVVRAGVTFEYTATGPRGLLNDTPVLVITASGGVHHGTEHDHAIAYFKTILSFIGLTRVSCVAAEGLAMPDLRDANMERAKNDIQAFASVVFG